MIFAALLSGYGKSFKASSKVKNNYGDNSTTGKFLFVNGVNLYYEI